MSLVEEDVAREQILGAGQVLGIGERLKAGLREHRPHVPAGADVDLLQRSDTVDETSSLDVGADPGSAVLFTGDGDFGGIITHLLELLPVGGALVLVVSDQVV